MAQPPTSNKRAVLIVDDEPDILESLCDLFEAALEGVACRTASSGQAALDILQKGDVDLILSDYKMPGMNGLQFLEKARQVAPDVPRMIMTAFPDLDVAIEAINEARIETFFTKPLDPDKVVKGVASALEARKLRPRRSN
ncbi:MAG: response regulator [Thermoplasmatota archaeon]|nr:response regulator [Halobacteriales archaeon]